MSASVKTYTVTLWMAGDIATANTAGEEEGFAVGFVNYPRFPSTRKELWQRARGIAERLRVACCQRSYLLVSAKATEWVSVDPPSEKRRAWRTEDEHGFLMAMYGQST